MLELKRPIACLAILAIALLLTACSSGERILDQSSKSGWRPLMPTLDPAAWDFQPEFWRMDPDGSLHGISPGGKEHHYMFSKASYTDYELQADFLMTGYNSGICVRIAPTSFDNVPGYQVDMGDGYWGCLWEEKGRGMVVKFPQDQAEKILRRGAWNHYRVLARGHHIQMWLNGQKTVDVDDQPGPLSGRIGFQLAHVKATDVKFKNINIRELAEPDK